MRRESVLQATECSPAHPLKSQRPPLSRRREEHWVAGLMSGRMAGRMAGRMVGRMGR